MTNERIIQEATAHHQAGRLAEAEALYRQVLQQEPENAGVLHLLGLIAHQVGQHEHAAALVAKAVQIAPTAIMYSNLGLIFAAQGKADLAMRSFRQALALQPDYIDARFQLGAVLQTQGQFDEAIGQFRQCIALQPDNPEAYYNLGVALHWQDRHAEAIEQYRKVIELKPDHARAHLFLGGSHIDLGQLESAEAEIKRALEIEPDNLRGWAMLTKTRKMKPEDEPWLQGALRLVTQERTALTDDAVGLWFAVGKYYDDTKQYDSAFAAYAQANALKRRLEGGFDRAAFSRFVDTQIATYTADFIRQQHAGASASERPVLIVGMPRSGTSLVEQIIASHPDAFGAGELSFWREQVNKQAAEDGHTPVFLEQSAAAYEQLLQRYSPTASRVVDKMPGNFCWLGLIATVFPHARIIHTQRNPVDTCLSVFFQNFNVGHSHKTDLDDLAFYYREYRRLMAHWRSVLPAERFLDVPYEALTADQEGWSRRIIGFLGLEWDERCLEFHKTERKVGTASNWQVRQKIYQTSKERWRNYEQHLGPLLGLLD